MTSWSQLACCNQLHEERINYFKYFTSIVFYYFVD